MGIKNRNLDIPASYGIDKVEGTPTIVILGPTGDVINLETAKTWRDAASRTEDAIFDEFEAYAFQGYYTPPAKTETVEGEGDEVKLEQVKSDVAKSDEVKPEQVEIDEVKPAPKAE